VSECAWLLIVAYCNTNKYDDILIFKRFTRKLKYRKKNIDSILLTNLIIGKFTLIL